MPAARSGFRYLATTILALLTLALCSSACNGRPGDLQSSEQTLQQRPSFAAATRAGPTKVQLDLTYDLSLDHGRIVIRGPWGQHPGAFGQRPEASRPGPMSLAIGADNTIHVLDQINRRVQRFDAAGRYSGQTRIAAATTETIALGPGGELYTLVYEPGAAPGLRVERYIDGQRAAQIPLHRSIQLVTGLYVTTSGANAAPSVWIEERHERQILVVAAGRALAPAEQTHHVLGRPYRGQTTERLSATRLEVQRAVVIYVRPGQGTTRLLDVNTPLPLLAIHALSSDRAGRIYLGLLLGRQAQPGHPAVDVHRMLLVHRGPQHQPLTIQLARHRTHDVFQPLALGPDGAVYQLHTTNAEVTVRRWTLPAARRGGAR